MAINVNEEGVMKPLTIDGAQTNGFTINGIELLFNGILEGVTYSDKYYKMPQFILPRLPQDYKFFIIIAVPKWASNASVSSLANTIAIIDLDRFFDGATITNTGGTIGYDHTYVVSCSAESIILKDDPNHTTLYIGSNGNSTSIQYHQKIFGVY